MEILRQIKQVRVHQNVFGGYVRTLVYTAVYMNGSVLFQHDVEKDGEDAHSGLN